MEDDEEPIIDMEETLEANNLFYYIINLISSPIQTLHEFDDYVASRSGLVKVVVFYFVSLLPVAAVAMVAGRILEYMPGMMTGSLAGSSMAEQSNLIVTVGQDVLKLFIYSLSIAIVNYFVTDQANFVTLTVYFAFVKGVTGFVAYTPILAIVGAATAITAPQFLLLVGSAVSVLWISFLIWTFALNIIVLMSTYGYGLFGAGMLALGAWIIVEIVFEVAANQLSFIGF